MDLANPSSFFFFSSWAASSCSLFSCNSFSSWTRAILLICRLNFRDFSLVASISLLATPENDAWRCKRRDFLWNIGFVCWNKSRRNWISQERMSFRPFLFSPGGRSLLNKLNKVKIVSCRNARFWGARREGRICRLIMKRKRSSLVSILKQGLINGHRSWNSTRLTLRSDDGYGNGNENVKQAITSNRFTLAK